MIRCHPGRAEASTPLAVTGRRSEEALTSEGQAVAVLAEARTVAVACPWLVGLAAIQQEEDSLESADQLTQAGADRAPQAGTTSSTW